jgi:hypothetical protein
MARNCVLVIQMRVWMLRWPETAKPLIHKTRRAIYSPFTDLINSFSEPKTKPPL